MNTLDVEHRFQMKTTKNMSAEIAENGKGHNLLEEILRSLGTRTDHRRGR
jgi:hypothetical protein